MDLGLSEEQQMLREFTRDFLENECPETHVRDMEADVQGYSPDLWRKMAEQGWPGLIVPEAYGGVGMTYMDLVILIEEFGRALTPGPFIPNCEATIALLEAATEAQKEAHLPGLAAGTQIWTVAFTEPSARFDAVGVQLEARRDGDAYVLNGTKIFVRDSHVADRMVVVARTGGAGEDGVSLFIVDGNASGVRHTPIPTIASDRQNEVRFEDVRVPASGLMGEEGRAWPVFERVMRKATVLNCAYLVGLIQMAADITLDYTKDRTQFERPIASFQAMQHKAADVYMDVDSSRYVTYDAAWAVAVDGSDADEKVHIAKAWVNEASRRIAGQCQQMHGGIGFTRDYKIQLYYRRQKAAELAWGDADFHRDLVGQKLGI